MTPGVGTGRDERGSGTLLVVGGMSLVMVIAGVALVLTAYIAAQHAAADAADLSALSGAAAHGRGEDPCAAAREVARANGVTLSTCRVSGDSFDFVVRVGVIKHVRSPPRLPDTVSASAEAGRLSGG